MSRFSAELRHIVTRQHGVVSGTQLRTTGISPESIDRWRLRRLIVSTHVDTYRVASAPDTLESRCVTASIAHAEPVVGGAAAAALWDFDHVFRPTRPECVYDRSVTIGRRVHGVAYRSVRSLDPGDVVERGDVIRVLGRASTWLDCVGQMNIEHGVRFTNHVLDSQCDLDELWDVVDRREAARRGKPGKAHMILVSLSSQQRQLPAQAA